MPKFIPMKFIYFNNKQARIPGLTHAILVFRCKECNSSVIFDDSNDIVYLYRLAEESPLLYAKLALKGNGLQDYVDAMSEFN